MDNATQTIHQIAKRAAAMYADAGIKRDLLDITLDLEATHKVCPLKLDELLAADDGHFSHDIGGIARSLNRETGQLEDCFLPRFAQ